MFFLQNVCQRQQLRGLLMDLRPVLLAAAGRPDARASELRGLLTVDKCLLGSTNCTRIHSRACAGAWLATMIGVLQSCSYTCTSLLGGAQDAPEIG